MGCFGFSQAECPDLLATKTERIVKALKRHGKRQFLSQAGIGHKILWPPRQGLVGNEARPESKLIFTRVDYLLVDFIPREPRHGDVARLIDAILRETGIGGTGSGGWF